MAADHDTEATAPDDLPTLTDGQLEARWLDTYGETLSAGGDEATLLMATWTLERARSGLIPHADSPESADGDAEPDSEGRQVFSSTRSTAPGVGGPVNHPPTPATVIRHRRTDGEAQPQPESGEESYELLDHLGEGGMGVVWRGVQNCLLREVAIKQVKEEVQDPATPGPTSTAGRDDAFVAEALINGYLQHPNIVPVYGFGRDQHGRLFLSMKVVGGHTWAQLLHPETEEERSAAADYDLDRHLELLDGVANAIAFSHAKGIVHRDLKPSNIMVGDFGEVLVMDWGLGAEFGPASTPARAPHVSDCTIPQGTPAYMAPELAAGTGRRQGPWTDVYLLGSLLYEIITGAPPHRADSLALTLARAYKSRPPSFPAGVPAELATICRQALSREPRARFQSVAAFQGALDDFRRHRHAADLLEHAEGLLARIEAGTSPDPYGDYARAQFDLEAAHDGWPEQPRLMPLMGSVRRAYAGLALAQGDLDLAASVIGGNDDPGLADIRSGIDQTRRQRQQRRRLVRVLGSAVVVLVLATIVGLTVGYVQIDRARQVVEAQRQELQRTNEALEDQRQQTAAALAEEQAAHDALVHAHQGLRIDRSAQIMSRAADLLSRPAQASQALARLQPDDPFARSWPVRRLEYLLGRRHQVFGSDQPGERFVLARLSPRGDRLAAIFEDGLVHLISMAPPYRRQIIDHDSDGPVTEVMWAPNGGQLLLAVDTTDRFLVGFGRKGAEVLARVSGFEGGALATFGDTWLFLADGTGQGRFIERRYGKELWKGEVPAAEWAMAAPAGNRLLLGDESGRLHAFDRAKPTDGWKAIEAKLIRPSRRLSWAFGNHPQVGMPNRDFQAISWQKNSDRIWFPSAGAADAPRQLMRVDLADGSTQGWTMPDWLQKEDIHEAWWGVQHIEAGGRSLIAVDGGRLGGLTPEEPRADGKRAWYHMHGRQPYTVFPETGHIGSASQRQIHLLDVTEVQDRLHYRLTTELSSDHLFIDEVLPAGSGSDLLALTDGGLARRWRFVETEGKRRLVAGDLLDVSGGERLRRAQLGRITRKKKTTHPLLVLTENWLLHRWDESLWSGQVPRGLEPIIGYYANASPRHGSWFLTGGGSKQVLSDYTGKAERLAKIDCPYGRYRIHHIIEAPGRQRVAVASNDGAVHVWDLADNALRYTENEVARAAVATAFDASGERLAIARVDEEGGNVHEFMPRDRHDRLVRTMETATSTLTLVDLQRGEALPPVTVDGYLRGIAWDPSGDAVIAVDQRARLIRLDGQTGELLQMVETGLPSVVVVDLLRDERLVAVTGPSGGTRIFDFDFMPVVTGPVPVAGLYRSVFGPRGELMVDLDEEGRLRIWETTTGRELHRETLRETANDARGLAWRPQLSWDHRSGDIFLWVKGFKAYRLSALGVDEDRYPRFLPQPPEDDADRKRTERLKELYPSRFDP